MKKTREELQKELDEANIKLEQYQHLVQRLENRLLPKWRCWLRSVQWPATGEAWARVGGWTEGGARGWLRSMQSLAGSLTSPASWPPWGLRRFHALRGIGLKRFCCMMFWS